MQLIKKVFNSILILVGILLMVALFAFAIMMVFHVSIFGYTYASQNVTDVPYYYDQIDKNSYCENCEKNLSFINSNLIYIKSKNIDKEIISEFFNSNISINENLNKNLPEYCCICENQLEKIFYISLTQFNFKEGYNPICICQNCFDNLNNKDLNEFNRNNRMKEYCIHSDNLVLRKINSI